MKKITNLKQALFLSLLCSSTLFSKEIPQDVLDTGEKVSKELMKQLGQKLKHEAQTNGLLEAAKFCNSNALTLTEEINLRQIEGISVKRISLKERNLANIPKEDEKLVLQKMQTLLDKNELPSYLIEEENNVYKYYKPLIIKKELCLKCHGDMSENKELSTFFQESYPQDKAIGYKMGDLRGAILVQIKQ